MALMARNNPFQKYTIIHPHLYAHIHTLCDDCLTIHFHYIQTLVLKDVLCDLWVLGCILEVLGVFLGDLGRFTWCWGVLEGGDGGIFVVSGRFDVCFGRFRRCWGRSGVFGGWCWGVWGAFYEVLEAFGCVGGILGYNHSS